MPQIHVFCHRPGMNRGGRPNPRHAAYDAGVHSPAQLRELLAEPEVTVVIGEKLTEEHFAVIEAHAAKIKADAEAAKADAEAAKADAEGAKGGAEGAKGEGDPKKSGAGKRA